MNYRKFLSLFPLLIFAVCTSAFAQQDSVPLNSLIDKISKFTNNYPIEKVYLHMDKPYYAAGDTIWFKAYVTIDRHQLSGLSKIVYVDLINNQDSIMESQRLKVVNGCANGSIVLTGDAYKKGAYRIRSYTAWMRNFDPAYYYDRTINIGNAIDKDVNTNVTFKSSILKTGVKVDASIEFKAHDFMPYADKKVSWQVMKNGDVIVKGKGVTDNSGILHIDIPENQADLITSSTLNTSIELADQVIADNDFSLRSAVQEYDFQFFPESGQLTSGVTSLVAFKALASSGLGVDVKGTVTDDKGAIVANFTSTHLGMGAFPLTPNAEISYKADVVFPDGSHKVYDLPRVQSMGINLSVNNANSDTLMVKISASDVFYQRKQNQSFYLIAQSGGIICYAAQTMLQNQSYFAFIPKSKLPTGIVQVTLFSSSGYALCERIAFIQHNDLIDIALKTDKPAYTTRQNVKITVSAKNNKAPVQGNFSVAVIDDATVPSNEDAESTILSNLLLTSDLKGYIEKPNYYFNKSNVQSSADLDVLMLTQGYRRFVYEDIIEGKMPQIFVLPEQGIDISGTLRTTTGLPVPKGSMVLQVPDKNISAETTTDMAGNFTFKNVNVPDTSKVTLSARNNPNNNNLVVAVTKNTSEGLIKNTNVPDEVINIDSTLRPYIQNSRRQYQSSRILKKVVIKGVVIEKKPSHKDYTVFTGLGQVADHEITSNMLGACNNMLICLQGTAMGLTYDDGNFYITRNYNQGQKTPVAIYVGENFVDISYLTTLSPREVESVEIYLNDGLSGLNKRTQTSGLLIINLKVVKKQNISLAQLKDMIPKQNVVTFGIQGYTKSKIFYSPKYDVNKSTSLGTDLRTTIYWNPNVITDKTTGTATFNFFNSDNRGSYRAIIEGIDTEGNLGRHVIHYTVK